MKVTTAQIGMPVNERPSIAAAALAVSNYGKVREKALSTGEVEAIREISRRLERLAAQFDDLMALNDKFMALQGFSVDFDPATDTVIFKVGDVERRVQLKRADPSVPIQMRRLTEGGAYLAGSEAATADEPQLRLELEAKLESFYQSAHRILKLFGTIPELSRIRCAPITRVRNNLIEHPPAEQFYSFGFGSTGPRVKPMHRGTPAWNDEGLIPNTGAFVSAIVDGIATAGSKGART